MNTDDTPPWVAQYVRHHVSASSFKKVTRNLVARWPDKPTEATNYFISKMKLSSYECFPLKVEGFSNFTKFGDKVGPPDPTPVYVASATGYTLKIPGYYATSYAGYCYIIIGAPTPKVGSTPEIGTELLLSV